MLLLILFSLISIVLVYNFYWKRRNLPPGPVPLPIFGNALQLSRFKSTEAAYIAWSKEYGDIFTFWFGERAVIAVSSYEKIVEYFQKRGEQFQDRPDDRNLMNYTRGGFNGLIHIFGDRWKSQRRFALHSLRDFGLGKDIMEERVLEECTYLVDSVNESHKDAVAIPQLIDRAVGSIINNLLFGYRYTENNIKEFKDLKQRAQSSLQLLGHPLILAARPNPQLFEKLPFFSPVLKSAQQSQRHLIDFFTDRIQEHAKELETENYEEMRATDLVAAFIKEQKKLMSTNGDVGYFTDEQLKYFCFDIWVAGQETTSITITWGIAFLIHHPEVQKKIQEELDRVIGSDRFIGIQDRPQLPHLQAVCNETQRLANLVPSNVIHAAAEDVVVDGYNLSKGTSITPLISCVLYDEKLFPDPHSYKPERFIDETGKLKKVDELIPFSLGKRQCLGEGLARMEIFLFLGNLLNHFTFHPSKSLPSLERSHGITVKVRDFECKVEKRH